MLDLLVLVLLDEIEELRPEGAPEVRVVPEAAEQALDDVVLLVVLSAGAAGAIGLLVLLVLLALRGRPAVEQKQLLQVLLLGKEGDHLLVAHLVEDELLGLGEQLALALELAGVAEGVEQFDEPLVYVCDGHGDVLKKAKNKSASFLDTMITAETE